MKYFIKTSFLVATLCLILPLSAISDTSSDKGLEAIQAAEHFLKLIDQGEYGQSWDEASSLFVSRISKKEWVKTIGRARPSFGKTINRSVISKQFMTSSPGVPDGEYIMILFSSSFKHKKSALETVTTMLDKDGRWRVAGYFIK